MPYKADNPPDRIKMLPKEAQEIWIKVFNSAWDTYDGDEEKANAVAWHAVKQAGFKKVGDEWKKYELPETVNIEGVEIFSAAYNPNGHKYTDEQLDEMVVGFYETKDKIKPYLKLGHDNKQKLVQDSGMPAIGWIENVRRIGKKIIADLSHVPKKIYELMQVGAYRRVSAEIFWNIEVGGKKYSRLLKAVSLLGADTPACEDLDDIILLYSTQMCKSGTSNDAYIYDFEIQKYNIKEKEEVNSMEIKELESEVKKYQDEVAALKMKVQEVSVQLESTAKAKEYVDSRLAEAEKENETIRLSGIKEQIYSAVAKLVEEKHLLPVDKDAIAEVIYSSEAAPEVKKYKIGESEKSVKEILIDVLCKYSVDMSTEPLSEHGNGAPNADGGDMLNKALAYQKQHSVSFKEALRAVVPIK